MSIRTFGGGSCSTSCSQEGALQNVPGDSLGVSKGPWGPQGGLGWPKGNLGALEGFQEALGEV